MAVAMLACAGVRAQPSASESASASASAPVVAPVPVKVAASAIDADAVWTAEGEVRADPLWAGDEKKKVLRFKKKSKDQEPEKKAQTPDDSLWWIELFKNLSSGLRVALWLIVAAALIWVLLRLRDWLKGQEGGRALKAAPPTHVGSLDIRPESLPDDIGAAARALWQRGEQRAALSLLYRGALSRLVHGHGVPIRSASTERECLVLAAARVSPASLDFLSRLVSGWQTVAYAQRELPADRFEALCADFDARMAQGSAT
ncbi:hypothetical protein ABE85_09130 [Mitsuaria sp. 7]|nr:hypothetical protein ABE85_09130 [Mitsuaria sp. 7]